LTSAKWWSFASFGQFVKRIHQRAGQEMSRAYTSSMPIIQEMVRLDRRVLALDPARQPKCLMGEDPDSPALKRQMAQVAHPHPSNVPQEADQRPRLVD
jgi:hypothetical protein